MPERAANRHGGLWFFAPRGLIGPEATPADGPDPYGNPDPEWLHVDWGAHLHWTEVRGARVRYVDMGEGSPIVFVHGLGGCWENWLEQLPHFARSHRVVALDLPGFGDSPMPPWEISIEAHGRLVHDFCEQLGADPCALVGNSMGGFIAAEASTRERDLVDKLVLVSAAGISHARMRREPAAAAARVASAAAPLLLRLQEGSIRRPGLRIAAFGGVFHRPHRLRPELLWEQYKGAMSSPGFLDAVRGLVGYDILDRLTDVDDPTLIVWGRNDRVVSPADARGFARRLRNSRVVIFDRCGHVPQMERPVRFNRLLEEFLAERSPAPASTSTAATG